MRATIVSTPRELSPRESEIFRYLCYSALSIPEIARDAAMSQRAVKSVVVAIFNKLGCNSRLDLIQTYALNPLLERLQFLERLAKPE